MPASDRILFVDAHQHMRETVQTFLTDQNFSVDIAKTGDEALELAKLENYAVFLVTEELERERGKDVLATLHLLQTEASCFLGLELAKVAQDTARFTTPENHRYIQKILYMPWTQSELLQLVKSGLELHEERVKLRESVPALNSSLDAIHNILLVEERPAEAKVLSDLLDRADSGWFNVEIAPRLGLALDRLREETFNAVLIDLMLMDGQGIESISKIQAANPDVPIIALSNVDDDHIAYLAVQGGAQEFIAKGNATTYSLTRAIRHAIERKRSQHRLVYLANYDHLTGLANRVLFKDRLDQAIPRNLRINKMVGLLYFDLDRFKNANDTLGHDIGDALLKAVAARVKNRLRSSETVARLAGDEFTIILENINTQEDAVTAGQRILRSFEKPFQVQNHQLSIGASLGIATYPPSSSAEELLKHADEAMYQAKKAGGERFHLYQGANSETSFVRFSLERDLWNAVSREEFEVYYQPKVDIATGRMTGVEALLRWNHPKYGQILPSQFIRQLEKTGLIIPLGEWTLRTACREAKEWALSGFAPLRVAVNLSARQFESNIVEVVYRVLSETGLDPDMLELELTESVVFEENQNTLPVLTALKHIGVHLSIDDFGTGYSSLRYLKRYPVDYLKIDRSFVRRIVSDRGDATIASAIISLSHNLGLSVVAEGVETREQLTFLRAYGCDMFQGYLFAKPMKAQDFMNWLPTSHEMSRATATMM